jgi:1-acyl-sn-glycerol-3-phosphate acyltransferase
MSWLRAGSILVLFLGLTLPLMPVQAILLRLNPRLARHFPQWYHRRVCRLLGLRIKIDGNVSRDNPVLIVANHSSWLDIPAVSAVAPVSFIAKKEVGSWPFVSSLARLQRTVFIDRERRSSVGDTTEEILSRLRAGDSLVLFAEGTSSDGNRVLPFKTSLFAAAKPSAMRAAIRRDRQDPNTETSRQVLVQTMTIAYTRLHGIPLTRSDRPFVGWYGDMEMAPHAWRLLQAGPLDVTIRIGRPVPLDAFIDRKALAKYSEEEIRREYIRILRGGPHDEQVELARPEDEHPVLPPSEARRGYG